jgi:outer membrane lipoprotein SlyB
MSITRQQHHEPTAEHGRGRSLAMAAGAAATGVLGYGIALGLARATQYAEQVEEDEYCQPAAVPTQA